MAKVVITIADIKGGGISMKINFKPSVSVDAEGTPAQLAALAALHTIKTAAVAAGAEVSAS